MQELLKCRRDGALLSALRPATLTKGISKSRMQGAGPGSLQGALYADTSSQELI